MLTIFSLASGRSGTHFLYELFRRNAADCCCRHETYGWNPSMFGRPIYDRTVGETASIRRLVERKAGIIGRCARAAYVETSHAFLKSWSDLAPEFFPNLKLVHLIRDPLKVAKSEANRHEWLDWFRFPLRNYRGGDGRKYARWALTGLEPIFQHFADRPLTLFQRYAIQWIEIENRAMRFLDQFDKHAGCITFESPRELNDAERVRAMFDFLGLKPRQPTIDLGGRHNRNPRPTVVSDRERDEFAQVVSGLPANYLEIFCHKAYANMPWIECLRHPSQ